MSPEASAWTFAVSGDSRNCGNLVMPAIAAGARDQGVAFYWHLGDFRAIYKVDEDYVREAPRLAAGGVPRLEDYQPLAWDDFIQHQLKAFGDLPVYLGPGNHETIPPMSHAAYLAHFRPWLDAPAIHAQRLKDHPGDEDVRAYDHWQQGGVDFINLDNSLGYAFEPAQVQWFEQVVAQDLSDPAIRTLVVGMHEALPYSKSDDHSMCQSQDGIVSGEKIYRTLLNARSQGKKVYLLASHSHYYLENIYDVPHWRDPVGGGSVLPGWIVGTAGAERYPLPVDVTPGPDARQHVYGYLTGTVSPDGSIDFQFHELAQADIEKGLGPDYTPDDAAFCVAQNPAKFKEPKTVSCEAAAIKH